MSTDRPAHCAHPILYPRCGCKPYVITATDTQKLYEKQKLGAPGAPKEEKRGRGRPPSPWSADYKEQYAKKQEEAKKTPEQRKQEEQEAFLNGMLESLPNPEQRAALLKEMNSVLARANFAEFCQQAWHVVEPTTKLDWNWHHALICQIIQGIFEDWERAQDDDSFVQRVTNACFNVPPGSLKPVCEQGLVTEKTRGLVPLAEIKIGDEVLTHKGRFRKVLQVAEQGKLPVLEITTGRDRKIRAEGTHPFLTQRGWVQAKDLTSQDVLAEVHATEAAGNSTISPEEARVIGYIIGDGCISDRDTVSFTNQDDESVADFEYCTRAIGFEPTTRSTANYGKNGETRHVVGWRVPKAETCVACGEQPATAGNRCNICVRRGVKTEYKSGVRNWLIKHSLTGAKSATKRVPQSVMSGNVEVIINYLSAYWACDGTIQDRRDLPRAGRGNQTTQTIRVSATTISEGLARDHQHLLQRLGLSFRVRHKVSKLTRAMVGSDSGERIGTDYHSYDVVASDQDTAAKFMQVVGSHMRHEKRTRAQNLERTKFDQVLNADEIVSIEQVQDQVACRCLQVEEDASFVYQGVAVHNSRLMAVFFPCWAWLRRPGWKLIALSVNEDAAMRDARDSRVLIKSDWYQETFKPDWEIKKEQDAAGNFANNKGGVRLSRAAGSEIVGLRGDCICIDDANNPKEAESKIIREAVNEVWTTNIYNRVNHPVKSIRIGIQQRTHAKDWTGYVTSKDGVWTPENPDPTKWLHVVLPAEFDPARKCVTPWGSDPRSKKGQIIHSKRMTKQWMAKEKIRFGSYKFAGQMQQIPVLAEGGMVKAKWFRYFRYSDMPKWDKETSVRHEEANAFPPIEINRKHTRRDWDFDWTVISIDCAAKKTERGSQYGILVISGKGPQRFIRDDRTRRGDILEILAEVKKLCAIYDPDRILIEAKAAGPDLMTLFEDHFQRGTVVGSNGKPLMVVVDSVEPGNSSKESRLDSCIPELESGLVYVLENAEWQKDFIDEMASFPVGEFNDRVDAYSQAMNHMRAFTSYMLPDW